MAFPENSTEETRERGTLSSGTVKFPKYDRTILEGSLGKAVWKLAAPTVVANIFGGLQGLVDHIAVGNIVGFKGNAAIGVSWQIFLVVVVFVSSIFTGMGILVARFVGANEPDKVNRTVYQAFITAVFISLAIIAPIGYFASPWLLNFVNADEGVQAEALPYLRIMFLFSSGMMIYFMLAGALRSAGDARTPMVLGIVITVLNIFLSIVFIAGFGPIPSFGTKGAAIGTCIASGLVLTYSLWKLTDGSWVISLRNNNGYTPDWRVIRQLFKFGLPAGFQGITMNVGGVLLLSFIGSLAQSAAAQAAYAVSYTQLFSLVSWTSFGLMGATAAVVGQNLGAKQTERAVSAVHTAARFGLLGSVFVGFFFFFFPHQLLAIFGMKEVMAVEIGVSLLRFLSISGIFLSIALVFTGGLQGSGDTKSPFYISIVSQIVVPLGMCFVIQRTGNLQAWHIWLAILLGHFTRCILSIIRFNQGQWKRIRVDIETTAT
jgi:putative MATE family efflux protein